MGEGLRPATSNPHRPLLGERTAQSIRRDALEHEMGFEPIPWTSNQSGWQRLFENLDADGDTQLSLLELSAARLHTAQPQRAQANCLHAHYSDLAGLSNRNGGPAAGIVVDDLRMLVQLSGSAGRQLYLDRGREEVSDKQRSLCKNQLWFGALPGLALLLVPKYRLPLAIASAGALVAGPLFCYGLLERNRAIIYSRQFEGMERADRILHSGTLQSSRAYSENVRERTARLTAAARTLDTNGTGYVNKEQLTTAYFSGPGDWKAQAFLLKHYDDFRRLSLGAHKFSGHPDDGIRISDICTLNKSLATGIESEGQGYIASITRQDAAIGALCGAGFAGALLATTRHIPGKFGMACRALSLVAPVSVGAVSGYVFGEARARENVDQILRETLCAQDRILGQI